MNRYFLNYIKAKNQIIEIRGPNSISNFPNQNEIRNIKQETYAKASKPYKFDIAKKLINQDLKVQKLLSQNITQLQMLKGYN